ncbi:hypothetical protein [Streptomyces sp. NPDC091219]|uniref:hypothetical protein n=1 Tax=Streptomyces sp. NPDC091219 TaxID=3155193 RepID=UPI00344E0D20
MPTWSSMAVAAARRVSSSSGRASTAKALAVSFCRLRNRSPLWISRIVSDRCADRPPLPTASCGNPRGM